MTHILPRKKLHLSEHHTYPVRDSFIKVSRSQPDVRSMSVGQAHGQA